ncbi:MAG: tyrosine--tRNA ligase, partial [Kiritimatiellae bacterium]|nr:tyrosine--tRNA ligase [Kiritimatiellia bacterium]
ADQWGNITAGTDLVRKMRGKSAFGLTFPLLLDSSGRKFGKSEGNALFMDASLTSVYDWYQYFLRSADADVIRYLKVFSLRPLDEIAALEEATRAHPEERAAQKALAEELTRLVHGEAGLATAQGATKTLFGGDVAGKSAAELEEIFRDVKSAEVSAAEVVGRPVYAVAAAAGMFKSNGEARRMAAQGGLYVNGEKADDKRVFADSDLIDGRIAVLRQGRKANFLLKASRG